MTLNSLLPGRFADFALYYGFTPACCQPYRPRTKGKAERGIGYVRQNCWPRVSAEVAAGTITLATLNERAINWMVKVAHRRVHGTTGEVVADRLRVEQPRPGRLDARPRYDVAYQRLRHAGRDGRGSYQGQLYAVPLRYALSTITVRETLTCEGTLVAPDGHRLPPVLGGSEPVAVRSMVPPPPRGRPGASLVPLLGGVPPPVVPVRDLAVYEEVAHAALPS